MDKYRDIEQFSKYIKPFLIEKKLPTDIEFIKELSEQCFAMSLADFGIAPNSEEFKLHMNKFRKKFEV